MGSEARARSLKGAREKAHELELDMLAIWKVVDLYKGKKINAKELMSRLDALRKGSIWWKEELEEVENPTGGSAPSAEAGDHMEEGDVNDPDDGTLTREEEEE